MAIDDYLHLETRYNEDLTIKKQKRCNTSPYSPIQLAQTSTMSSLNTPRKKATYDNDFIQLLASADISREQYRCPNKPIPEMLVLKDLVDKFTRFPSLMQTSTCTGSAAIGQYKKHWLEFCHPLQVMQWNPNMISLYAGAATLIPHYLIWLWIVKDLKNMAESVIGMKLRKEAITKEFQWLDPLAKEIINTIQKWDGVRKTKRIPLSLITNSSLDDNSIAIIHHKEATTIPAKVCTLGADYIQDILAQWIGLESTQGDKNCGRDGWNLKGKLLHTLWIGTSSLGIFIHPMIIKAFQRPIPGLFKKKAHIDFEQLQKELDKLLNCPDGKVVNDLKHLEICIISAHQSVIDLKDFLATKSR